ncbi:hypothetical protein M138_4390 [Bacteroides fragilis str. S23L17]|nr:hypothetical protein M138_4975 [Bacteroides fragilis str. S23L17]EYE41606.1 hypothetical protein M138_4390 [Bacteroides fragilis str. S23L17]
MKLYEYIQTVNMACFIQGDERKNVSVPLPKTTNRKIRAQK